MGKVNANIESLFTYFDKVQGNSEDPQKHAIAKPEFKAIYNTLSEPQKAVFDSEKSVNLFLAGQGSGKTHLGGVISGYYIYNFPNVRGMIAANTYTQLTQSTMFRIREVWKENYGWREYN